MGDADEDGVDLDLLREAARDFLSGRVAQDSVKELAAMDWTGLLVEEKLGGSGWRPVETTVIAEELGRARNSSTWFGCVLAAAALTSAPGDVRDRWLPPMLDGSAGAGCALSGDTVRVACGDAIDILVTLGHNGIHLFEISEATPRSRDGELLDVSRAAWRVDLCGVESVLIGGPEQANRLLAVARVLLSADSLGAMSTTFERLVAYLKERIAFGVPIASFQAVQHRLVDLLVLEAKARAVIMKAARALEADEISDDAITLSAAAHAFVAAKATAAVDECMQLSGGIGFTWEYPLHHELRRVFTNGYLLGAARSSRALFAERSGWCAATTRPSEAQLTEYRHRVRGHIADHAPPFEAREGHRAPKNAEQRAQLRKWFATLFDAGFLGADWPVEHGGRADHHPLHDRILSEELLRARAPRPVDQVNLAAHVLLHFGSHEQKAALLPPIRRSEHIWCQLLSEPDAGSDIAAVRSRAAEQPDGTWRIDGQKTWITDGHWADMGLALIRTDPMSSRHHGLSVFAVPMSTPGVEVRPIRTINEAIEVNEVFLDGVAVPAASLIGEPGQGWSIIMAGLDFERFGIGGNVVLLELLIDDLVMVARNAIIEGTPALERDDIRQAVAELAVEVEVAKSFIDDHVERLVADAEQPGDGAIAKLSFAETYHRVSAYGAELAPTVCTVAANPRVDEAKQRLRECWLWSRAYTISGGSNEMMRNILAKRRLLLPSR